VKLPVRQLAQVADSGRFTSERQFALSVICQMRQLEGFAGKWSDTQQLIITVLKAIFVG
jgi:hypothetical protein